jgi:methyl-accepting chemotaxis protein
MDIKRRFGFKSILISSIMLQFALLLAVAIWGFNNIRTYLEIEESRRVSELIKTELKKNAAFAGSLLETMANSKYIQISFKDKDELADYSYPMLNRLNQKGVKILNYYTTDGRVYLKVADQKNLEEVKRNVPLNSAKEDKVVFGIEEEKGKTYGFVATPFYSAGQKIGIMELGISIMPLLEEMKEVLGSDVGIMLDQQITEVTDKNVLLGREKNTLKKEGREYRVYRSVLNEDSKISMVVLQDVTFLNKTIFRTEALIIATLGLISLMITYLIYLRVLKPLSKIIAALKDREKGDLKKQIEDFAIKELSQGINSFIQNIQDMIRKVLVVSESVVTAAGSIHTNMEELSKGSKVQSEFIEGTSSEINQMGSSIASVANDATQLSQVVSGTKSNIINMTVSIEHIAANANSLSGSVETTVSSIEVLHASVKQISNHIEKLHSTSEETSSTLSEFSSSLKSVETHAKESALLSERVKKDASELGMNAIDKTIEGMNRIMKSSEATNVVITRLSGRSEQIGKILTVISEVTQQTNLLALNAAIIAAQSGEQGKAFAVVADEVKSLADRAEISTKEIQGLITDVQNEATEAVNSVREGFKNVEEGVRLSLEAKDSLKKILETSDQSSNMAIQIEKATIEQTKGITHITEAMQKISNMINSIAGVIQEQQKQANQITLAVQEMKKISEQVRQSTLEQTEGSSRINHEIENVDEKAHSIATSTKEQEIGSKRIVDAVENLRTITQNNVVLATGVKTSVDTLLEQAEHLKVEIKQFNV